LRQRRIPAFFGLPRRLRATGTGTEVEGGGGFRAMAARVDAAAGR